MYNLNDKFWCKEKGTGEIVIIDNDKYVIAWDKESECTIYCDDYADSTEYILPIYDDRYYALYTEKEFEQFNSYLIRKDNFLVKKGHYGNGFKLKCLKCETSVNVTGQYYHDSMCIFIEGKPIRENYKNKIDIDSEQGTLHIKCECGNCLDKWDENKNTVKYGFELSCLDCGKSAILTGKYKIDGISIESEYSNEESCKEQRRFSDENMNVGFCSSADCDVLSVQCKCSNGISEWD